MHFQISKSTLDSLKSVFNEFRRKPSLGALGETPCSSALPLGALPLKEAMSHSLFRKLKRFSYQLNSKNNTPGLLFKTIFWH